MDTTRLSERLASLTNDLRELENDYEVLLIEYQTLERDNDHLANLLHEAEGGSYGR